MSELSEKTFGGGTPKTSNDSFWKGNIPWIQSSDLVEGSLFDVEPRKYISQEAVDKSATKLVPEKSVAIVTRVGVGKLAFMPFSYATSQDFLSLSVLKTEPQFTVYALYKKLQSELNDVQGTSIKGVTKDELLAKEVMIPCYKEQEKIGSYLHSLDHLITLHQRKLDKLSNVKKALLEKMFPKNDSDVPEIRFKGFTDAWEQRKVEEVANRYDNLRIPVAANERTSGTTPYYGANGIQDYVSGYTHDGEFILVAEDGANDLKNYPVQYVSGKIWVNNHAHVLQATEKNDNKFLKYNISQMNIEPFLVGGGRAKLNAETMMKIDLTAPKNHQEQKQIGCFFHSLDNLITLHQRKLEKLKNIKKACLEKMFV